MSTNVEEITIGRGEFTGCCLFFEGEFKGVLFTFRVTGVLFIFPGLGRRASPVWLM